MNRLVYSNDLDDPTADLKILARLTFPTGPDAIAAKADFGVQNFALSTVPEPGSLALMLGGLLALRRVARGRGGVGRIGDGSPPALTSVRFQRK